jgi:1A family penicillin-binding protein
VIQRKFTRLAERLAALARQHRRAFVALVIAVSIVTWTSVGAAVWFAQDVATDLPDNNALRGIGTMAQATTLVDVKGRTAFTIYQEQRIDVPLSGVSRHLLDAILAVEDQRFYDHGGVDLVRVLGAAVNNLRKGRAAQGGSTLTQQLARQSFLTPDKTYRRKLKEVLVAARLEREFSKDDILKLYLNKVYFGDGLYGVEAASLGYFGKHASELDVPQAALLAGLVKSPSTYAPTVSPARAVARRNVVLQLMRETGAIDGPTYQAAQKTPLKLVDGLRQREPYGQHFKEEVRKQLVQQFGWDRVYQGGLKVYTTIDLDLQKAAESEVLRSLNDIEQRQSKKRRAENADEPLQAALVAMDPHSGEVRAMVGGRDFNTSHFNRATQAKRQPGSAFKPFIYAAALERGYSPGSLITNLDDPIATVSGAWVPEDEHSDGDSMTMRAALRTSSNRAAVKMLQDLGIPSTVQFVQKLGVGDVPSVPSLALGSGEVTLVGMTAAYATFANQGMVPTPTLIRRVETTTGQLLFESAAPPRRAVSESTAFLMRTMMADVINAGTATTARAAGFTLPAAGKTGTTNDYHDAWFVGFTPKLVTGVWVGYDQPRTIISNGYAAQLAVPMWAHFMIDATRGDDPAWFKAPDTITSASICRLSGKLANDACRSVLVTDDRGNVSIKSQVYTEYFVRGTEPVEYCPLHSSYPQFPGSLVSNDVAPPPHDAHPSDRADGPHPAAATAGAASSAPAAASPPAEPPKDEKKKRGFWGRIFGR